MRRVSLFSLMFMGAFLGTACEAGSGSNNVGGGGQTAGTAGSQGGNGGQGGTSNVGAGDIGGDFTVGSGGSQQGTCPQVDGVDDDNDGFLDGEDCNECDANVNPGAVETIAEPDMNGMTPEPADEDCDGMVDNVAPACDAGLAVADSNPMSGAKAIELCQQASTADKKWGVLEAGYVRADGTNAIPPNALQWGIKPKFGQNVNPQGGDRMLVLSAGYARDTADGDACGSTTCVANFGGNPPPGFPQDVPNCSGSTSINDDVALQLKIRTPKNATGYKFNFKFYSFEFPEWICTSFNDQFIALVNPAPMGSINGNISFDKNTNPVSVNIAFFDVCDPASQSMWAQYCGGGCPPVPSPYCPSGTAELIGTGFKEWDLGSYAGGTSWLQTQAPVKGGDVITIRYAIWDTGDQALDSTAVIDNFQWIANGGTVNVNTGEIPDPK
ncbi:MAG: choice-of-anchor L domain-containing protein [Polyangiaceae bacterium]|nr:choice-of-anchor L domain-containing protein [Polyangiaceae bacterium]